MGLWPHHRTHTCAAQGRGQVGNRFSGSQTSLSFPRNHLSRSKNASSPVGRLTTLDVNVAISAKMCAPQHPNLNSRKPPENFEVSCPDLPRFVCWKIVGPEKEIMLMLHPFFPSRLLRIIPGLIFQGGSGDHENLLFSSSLFCVSQHFRIGGKKVFYVRPFVFLLLQLLFETAAEGEGEVSPRVKVGDGRTDGSLYFFPISRSHLPNIFKKVNTHLLVVRS